MSVESTGPRPVALVVEDDEDTVELLDHVLTRAGFAVITADNGPDGIALAAEHQPALATVDINMPGMDGFETTRRIREACHTYIVIVSSRAHEDDVLAGFDAGADDYVPKPIRPMELQARLSAVARRPFRPVAGGPAEPPPGWAPAEPDQEHVAILEHLANGLDDGMDDGVDGEVDHEADDDGADGRDGMAALGMRFVGSWVEFHGLRINPARGIVVVDDRIVDLEPDDLVILEVLLYCGTRTVGPRQLAERLRRQGDVQVPTGAQAEAWVAARVDGLRAQLGDPGRWFEDVAAGRYRLVRA